MISISRQRLKEPSTWAGIAGIIALLTGMPATTLGTILQGVGVVAGLLAAAMPEKGGIAQVAQTASAAASEISGS